MDVEDIEIDEEEESVKSAERRIRKEEVWREVFLTSVGRDKALVRMMMLGLSCVCYLIIIYLQTRKLFNFPFGLG